MASHIGRRKFLATLGGAAAAWPLATRAQQPERVRRIGVLSVFAKDDPEGTARDAAFQQTLADLGWTVGRNVRIDYRWTEGDTDGLRKYAAELVALAPDVILTQGSQAIGLLLQQTRTVPIVFVSVDPVGAGFAASLARPGGNTTGLSLQTTDHAAKRVELLRELMPAARRLAILVNSRNPGAVLELREAETAIRALGLEPSLHEIQHAEDIAPAFEAMKGQADGLYVCTDVLVNVHRVRINTLALGARLPTMYSIREYVEAGGLMSYGPNLADMFRRAAGYVDRILRGAKPADLPIEQPTKFELVVNLTTAKALGIEVPPTLLARADEVIE